LSSGDTSLPEKTKGKGLPLGGLDRGREGGRKMAMFAEEIRQKIIDIVEYSFADSLKREIWGSLEEYVYGARSCAPSYEVVEEATLETLLTWLLETGMHKLLD